jgi:hypothetical protein
VPCREPLVNRCGVRGGRGITSTRTEGDVVMFEAVMRGDPGEEEIVDSDACMSTSS